VNNLPKVESRMVRVRLPTVSLSGDNLRQVVHAHVPLSIWFQSKSGDALQLGKVTMATRHKPKWYILYIIHLQAEAEGAYITLQGARYSLPYQLKAAEPVLSPIFGDCLAYARQMISLSHDSMTQLYEEATSVQCEAHRSSAHNKSAVCHASSNRQQHGIGCVKAAAIVGTSEDVDLSSNNAKHDC